MEAKKRKYIFIIGAMKSGTSSVFSLLAQHPSICPSQPKEPEFFARKDYVPEMLEEYPSLWDCKGKEQVIYYLEGSTSYTKTPIYPNAAERIKEAGLDAHFIYMMRHPYQRLKSHLSMALMKNWPSYDRNGYVAVPLIHFSRYHMQINEYYQRFPKERILLLRFEDFKADPKRTMVQIFDFLQLDRDFKLDYDRMNKHEGVVYKYKDRSLPLKIKTLLVKFQDMYHHQKGLKNIFGMIEEWLDRRMNRAEPGITEEDRQRIISILEDDLKKLEKEYNVDTSIWELHDEK
jgi:hypothetical protein